MRSATEPSPAQNELHSFCFVVMRVKAMQEYAAVRSNKGTVKLHRLSWRYKMDFGPHRKRFRGSPLKEER